MFHCCASPFRHPQLSPASLDSMQIRSRILILSLGFDGMSKDHGLKRPVQKRSQQSLDRLVEASIDLMSEGNFDDMPLTEIIRKADCSVGAFYGRFDGKESLFHHVQGYVLNEGVQWIDQQIDLFMNNKIDTVKNITTEDAARFIVTLLYEFYSRKKGLIRAIFLHTRVKRDLNLLEQVQKINLYALNRAENFFSGIDGDQIDADRMRRWKIGLQVVLAYLREEILFDGALPVGVRETAKPTVEDLTALYFSYIAADELT